MAADPQPVRRGGILFTVDDLCCWLLQEGAESDDWRAGAPVRVVRGYKAQKHSKFAPKEGFRYDGIYKVNHVL